MRDLYRTLGVKPNATSVEIKDAYRALARQHHPDRHGGDTKAEERFKEISLAYQTLSNPERRRAYDRERELAPPPIDPKIAAQEMGLTGVFSALFGKR